MQDASSVVEVMEHVEDGWTFLGFRVYCTPIALCVDSHHRACFGGAVSSQLGHHQVELEDELPHMFVQPKCGVAPFRGGDYLSDILRVYSYKVSQVKGQLTDHLLEIFLGG